MAHPTRLSDQIRAAIDASGVSRYRISKDSGIDQATLSRFMAGRAGLSIPKLDALGVVLGLRIVMDDVSVPSKVAAGRKPKAR